MSDWTWDEEDESNKELYLQTQVRGSEISHSDSPFTLSRSITVTLYLGPSLLSTIGPASTLSFSVQFSSEEG